MNKVEISTNSKREERIIELVKKLTENFTSSSYDKLQADELSNNENISSVAKSVLKEYGIALNDPIPSLFYEGKNFAYLNEKTYFNAKTFITCYKFDKTFHEIIDAGYTDEIINNLSKKLLNESYNETPETSLKRNIFNEKKYFISYIENGERKVCEEEKLNEILASKIGYEKNRIFHSLKSYSYPEYYLKLMEFSKTK